MMWTLLKLININIVILCVFLLVFYYITNIVRRRDIFDRFSGLLYVFEKSKDTAYKKMFREHILVYSSSGYRIDKAKIDEIQSLYVKYVYRISGPKIMEELELIYGNLDSICLHLVNDFIHRIEQDEYSIISKVSETTEDNIINTMTNKNE